MAEIISKSQCPVCAAKGKDTDEDNLGMFEDGNQSCIVCKHFIPADGEHKKKKEEVPRLAGDMVNVGEVVALPSRGLRKETMKKYGIRVHNDNQVIFEIRNQEGEVIGQKLKNLTTGKIVSRGKRSGATLFGSHLFQPKEGQRNRLIITEGELDAPSVFQTISNNSNWPVVSIIDGADDSDKGTKVVNEFKRNFDYINSWSEIVLCFDNDDAGRKSVDAVKKMFPGKVYITQLTKNDPSDYLQEGGSTSTLYKEIWDSPKYRPDSLIHVNEVDKNWKLGGVLPYISDNMTVKMLGRKMGTATLCGSGTGSGKSTMIRVQTLRDLENGVSVALLALEESPVVTLWELAGLRLNKPVRNIMYMRELKEMNPNLTFDIVDDLGEEELQEAMDYIGTLPLILCNLEEGTSADDLLSLVEYLSVGMGCQEIIIDHITRVQVESNDELDAFVDKLISLVERLPFHLTAISQLNQGDSSQTHEEGKRTTLKDFRGSQKLVSLFHEIIAFNRNQQAECPVKRNTVEVYSLKSRISNYTGYLESLVYNSQTGRLTPTERVVEEVFNDESDGSIETSQPKFKDTIT